MRQPRFSGYEIPQRGHPRCQMVQGESGCRYGETGAIHQLRRPVPAMERSSEISESQQPEEQRLREDQLSRLVEGCG